MCATFSSNLFDGVRQKRQTSGGRCSPFAIMASTASYISDLSWRYLIHDFHMIHCLSNSLDVVVDTGHTIYHIKTDCSGTDALGNTYIVSQGIETIWGSKGGNTVSFG